VPRKPSEVPITRHHVSLYEGQYARLQNMHPDLGAAAVIRKLVDDFLRRHDTPQPVKLEVEL
jgi:hypothetical protein